jgi:hypothetical protein
MKRDPVLKVSVFENDAGNRAVRVLRTWSERTWLLPTPASMARARRAQQWLREQREWRPERRERG